MDTDLDTLATALFVKTDDLLKSSPQLAPRRPTAGITPQLSDAELVTLAMMQTILGFTSEARWLRHARAHLRHLFQAARLQQAIAQGRRTRPSGHTRTGHGHSTADRRCMGSGLHTGRMRPFQGARGKRIRVGPGRDSR